MEEYDAGYTIGYAIASMIPLVAIAAVVGVLLYLIIKRSNEKRNETFEDRDN